MEELTLLSEAPQFEQVQSILDKNCNGCHSQPTLSNRNIGLSDYQAILDSNIIIAGNAPDSRLFQVINDGSMPQNLPPLSAQELDLISRWIDAGASNEEGIPTNEIPIVTPGVNRVLILPSGDTVDTTLVTSVDDPDGNIIRTLWTLISGPDNPDLSGERSTTLTILGLDTGGVYVYEILVEDDQGAIVRKQMTVTVELAPTISLADHFDTRYGDTSFTITSMITDDGAIQSISWSLLSGPSNLTFANGNTANPTVSGFISGTYVLRVTAIDNFGIGSTKDTNLNVIVSYSEDVEPVLLARCMTCHSNALASGGLSVETHADLISSNKFTVGNSTGSGLLNRINRAQGTDGFMPKNGTKLAPNTIKLIQDWINQGALDN